MPLAPKPKDKFSRYTDPTGQMSNRELTFGEWYVSHKIMLRNIFIGVLGIWSFISVGYSLVAWGAYATSGYFDDRALARRQVRQIQDYTAIQQNYKAKPLDMSALRVYTGTDSTYDFVVNAKNPNSQFIITVRFLYTYDGGQTAEREVLLLPQSTVPIAFLGHVLESYPSNPTLKIVNIGYERVSTHDIPKIQDFVTQRTKFTVENVTFTPPQEGVLASRITFDLVNNTVFSFWEPFFFIEIMSGEEPVGIMSTTVSNFGAEERRTIEVATFTDITGADSVRVTPVMNVFENSIYKK